MKRKPKIEYNVGDQVRVMDETHGWGGIDRGSVGTVAKVCKDGLEVDFQTRKNWFGRYSCFDLVKKGKGVVLNG